MSPPRGPGALCAHSWVLGAPSPGFRGSRCVLPGVPGHSVRLPGFSVRFPRGPEGLGALSPGSPDARCAFLGSRCTFPGVPRVLVRPPRGSAALGAALSLRSPRVPGMVGALCWSARSSERGRSVPAHPGGIPEHPLGPGGGSRGWDPAPTGAASPGGAAAAPSAPRPRSTSQSDPASRRSPAVP